MSLWRRTSAEVSGAWRSLRYDMGRRPSDPPAGGPDVTSTGMSTFGGPALDLGSAPIELPAPRRPPRGAALVSVFGLLTVLGAAGAYLIVVNGLVPLRDEQPAAAGTFPPRPPAVTADSEIGPSTLLPRPHAPSPAAAAPAGDGVLPASRHLRPVRTTKPANPADPACACAHPPVPTPTAPASSASPTPSGRVTPSGSPSATPSDWDIPDETPEPGNDWRTWHHHRRR